MTEAIEGLSFEAAMAELEAVVRKLEGWQVALEESIALYERGAALRAHCDARLRAAFVSRLYRPLPNFSGLDANVYAPGLSPTPFDLQVHMSTEPASEPAQCQNYVPGRKQRMCL